MQEKSNHPSLKRTVIAFVFLLLSVLCFGCKKRGKPEIILQREWIANAEFVGDLQASRLAAEEGWVLTVLEGSEIQDPVQEVRSERAHFGVASADRVLKENELGANLAIIATATPKSPVVFLGHASDILRDPHDFIGKSVGIQSGTNTELVFEALVLMNNLDRSKIDVLESGWGTGEFTSGQVQILAAFDYDEPVQLDEKKFPYKKLYPADHRVDFIGTVYFTRRELIKNDPTTVAKFVQVLVRGWDHALDQQQDAIEYLFNTFPENIDPEKESRSLSVGEKYFKDDNGTLLYASRSRWEAMAEVLKRMDYLKNFQFEKNIDYSFLEQAH